MGDCQAMGVSPGQKVLVKNIGVKRLAGADLVAKGKIPNWAFYIDEINAVAVWAGTAALDVDVWYGGLGYPVAGDNSLRDSLIALEGQRYWSTEDNIAYVYAGGTWTESGTPSPAAALPTTLVLNGSNQLSLERRHLFAANGTYTLPAATASDNGHTILFQAANGVAAAIIAAGTGTTITRGSATGESAYTTVPSVLYRAVYKDGVWEIFDTLARAVPLSTVSTGATPDTVLRRDASGRGEAAAGVSGDDLLTWQNKTSSSIDTSAGKLLKVGDYGLPDALALTTFFSDNLDLITVPYVHGTTAVAVSNLPPDFPAGTLTFDVHTYGVYGTGSTSRLTQTITITNGVNANRTWIRNKHDSTWTGWKELYTARILNVKEFGGIGAGDRVASGEVLSASELRFYLPIFSFSLPTSITITGTFTARYGGAASGGHTPVLRADISSNRIAVIRIDGLAGLTPGQVAVLEQDTAASKIEVNF